MAITINSAKLSVGYNINTPMPIDARTVVDYKEDLISEKSWANYSQYKGLITYVKNTNEFYALTGDTAKSLIEITSSTTNDAKNDAYAQWTQLPTLDNLDSLSKAFQFKGVASAIDSDNCTLTTGNATNSSGKAMEVIKQVTDVEGDLYYGWSSDSTNVTYWTRGKLENGVTAYRLELYSGATSFEYNNTTYYLTGDTKSVTVGTTTTTYFEFLSIDGDAYWATASSANKSAKISTTPGGTEVTTVTIASAKDVYWATESGTVSSITGASGTETASKFNIGHVYQLGENEYASNGKIWVQLGNPREDWIVI